MKYKRDIYRVGFNLQCLFERDGCTVSVDVADAEHITLVLTEDKYCDFSDILNVFNAVQNHSKTIDVIEFRSSEIELENWSFECLYQAVIDVYDAGLGNDRYEKL